MPPLGHGRAHALARDKQDRPVRDCPAPTYQKSGHESTRIAFFRAKVTGDTASPGSIPGRAYVGGVCPGRLSRTAWFRLKRRSAPCSPWLSNSIAITTTFDYMISQKLVPQWICCLSWYKSRNFRFVSYVIFLKIFYELIDKVCDVLMVGSMILENMFRIFHESF